MTHVYGWWDYDETDRPSLINRTTGERLRYAGVVKPEDVPSASFWMRFDYESAGIRYPLLVELAEELYWPRPFMKNKGALKDTLKIDHLRSAALWRREANVEAEYPPYGVWRRVDDCATDALACWPGLPEVGAFPVQLIVVGGWLNGAWNPDFTRTIWVPGESDRVSEADQTTMIATKPFVMPLDAPIPSPWQFHNSVPEEGPNGNSPMQIGDYVTLKNLRKAEQYGQPSGGYVVPAGESLTGF